MTTVARRSSRLTDMLSWLDEAGLLVKSGPGLVPGLRVEDYVDEGTYVLRAEMPGIDPDRDLDVYIEGDALVLRGERRDEKHEKDHHEFHYGAFERSVRLPQGADLEKVSARYDDGVLELRLPLDAERVEVRRVDIPIQRVKE